MLQVAWSGSTVVTYFRTQFVDTRDRPASLPEFYYKYNNRVHRSTKPMTQHLKCFTRPTFSVAVEDQLQFLLSYTCVTVKLTI